MPSTLIPYRPIRAAIFSHLEDADGAIEQLLLAGFTKDHLSVVCSERAVQEHFRGLHHEGPAGGHTASAVFAGSAIGALGGLTAIALGAVTGGAVLLAAGGLALATGGAVGGLIGAMMTRGFEKEIANYYDQAVARGKILVAAEALDNDPEGSLLKAERVFANAQALQVPLPEG
jgi:hypothetical protein